MKKHCKEENFVSKKGPTLIKPFLLGLLFISNISAQIPINGFCRYSEIHVKQNYSNIFPLDFNSDGYRDLLLLSESMNRYLTITLDNKANFGKVAERFNANNFSSLHLIGGGNSRKRYYALSRKNKNVLIAEFSKNGTVSVLSKLKLNGYPSTIDAGDIDGDGVHEALVAGAACEGLTIVKEKKGKLQTLDVIKGKIFSAAAFMDLDYDTFADIAAVDLMTNSIILFYNDQFGAFIESRSIALGGKIRELKVVDFNSDGFTDISFIQNNRFEVLLGDSISSFQKKMILETPVKPDKYSILDFNGDGYNDVAFINSKEGALYISYAKGDDSFYQPILYLIKNGLTDLASFVDRGGRKIALLDSSGKVYFISSIIFRDESFSISLGAKPAVINTFDYLNDGFKDICFIDENERSLKIVLSERRNLFRIYSAHNLSNNYSNIVIDDILPKTKTFYCYSKGAREVELVKIDLEKNKISKEVLYANAPIEELKISKDKTKDRQSIILLSKKEGKLSLQIFDFRDFRYVSSGVYPIADNVNNASFILNGFKDIYYSTRQGQNASIYHTIVDNKIIKTNTLASFSLNKNSFFNSELVCFDELDEKNKTAAAVVTLDNKSTLFLFGKKTAQFNLKNYVPSNSSLQYFANGNGLSFFYLDTERNKLRKITLLDSGKSIKESDIIASNGINNYFVAKLNRRNIYLVFSNKFQNTLTFEKL